jgi:hypothetical protein
MEKIKGLLKQIGASDEFASQLCEELERYDQQVQDKYEAIYTEKVAQAKQICVEEVAKYKVDLARKVRVFLESKSSQVEKRLDQQRSSEEGEAKAMLRKVKELTEGIEVADDAELQGLRNKIQKLEEKTTQLAEDKQRAIVAANRANKIALEVLDRKSKEPVEESKEAVTEEPAKSEETVSESKEAPVEAKAKTETKKKLSVKSKKALKESIKKTKTKQAKPKTTRRTLAESQTLKSAKSTDESLGIEADSDILDIANGL